MRRTLIRSASLCGTLALLAVAGTTPADAAATCDRVAAPAGSDAAAGTAAAPFRTATKLVGSLARGQVGCLRAGTYREDVAIAHAGVTLTSYPGETATVVGRFWIKDGADDVVVSALHLNGVNASGLPSPTVNGDGAQFVGNDVTDDHTGICFVLGNDQWGRAQGTVIRGNRIHDCGRIPSTNHDHGIYVAAADDTQILDNVIYDNVDRGVQLYPDAQRTVIRGNIIDGNGEGIIFSGDHGLASHDNVVEGNVITNATIRADVESYYPPGNPIGHGNVVSGNCLAGGAQGTINASGGGFTATGNTTVSDPGYVARRDGDFRLTAGSPCAATLRASEAPAGGFGVQPVTSTQSPPAGGEAASDQPAATDAPAPARTTTPVHRAARNPAAASKPRFVARLVRPSGHATSVRPHRTRHARAHRARVRAAARHACRVRVHGHHARRACITRATHACRAAARGRHARHRCAARAARAYRRHRRHHLRRLARRHAADRRAQRG